MKTKMTMSEAGRLGAIASRDSIIRKQEERIENYNSNPSLCSFCNSALPYKQRRNKFCNHSCSASSTNKGQPKHGEKKIAKKCANCDTLTLNPLYCSLKCQGIFQSNQYLERWKSGLENGISGNGVSSIIKNYLRLKYDNKCSSCGWCQINPVTNKVPLQVEHINGQWDDNREENLTLLCPNCHSLTPTFGALNRGNGRDLRGNRRKNYPADDLLE